MELKGELVRWAYQSKLGQEQFKRRIVLRRDAQKTRRRCGEDIEIRRQELEVIGEFDLNSIADWRNWWRSSMNIPSTR